MIELGETVITPSISKAIDDVAYGRLRCLREANLSKDVPRTSACQQLVLSRGLYILVLS